MATHTINKNDCSALSAIAIEAKENLGIEAYTALVDKGYHNGKQIEICKQANIITIVAQPEQGKSNENDTTKDYLVAQFQYNQDNDTYTCLQGEMLKTTGSWHKKTTERDSYNFKKYQTPKCKECPVKHL
ncbi:hypothetical protein [Flavobacterium sp. Sr18]|uniref:hypothetical protein n=1 Tax=Flavobacterium sp. Sr18 TaxID=935222 RepID=UPI001F49D165|nr:hypothetical protein [Flavobacterium sp. Sr18]